MLDRIDAGDHGVLDPLGPVGVRGDLAPRRVRLLDRRAELLDRELRRPGWSPRDMTPPVAWILITSTPCFNCARTTCRTWSGPSAIR